MKKILLALIFAIAVSCNSDSKKDENNKTKNENFPKKLGKVFEKHGSLKKWREAQILSFNKGEEVHTVDLHSRKTVINSPKYSLGYNGKEVWLDQDSTYFKGNPTFYYNLYFYFYAMPFVLADDGIIYEKVEDLTFKGINYPGYKISYNANVGTTPDDNYIVYYNPESNQMEWLAYTVTFTSKKPSDKYKIIRYNKWENVNGLLLPKEITWYKKDDKGMPLEAAKPATKFSLPLVSKAKLADSFFEKPIK